MADRRKLRIATTSLAGCFGCHMSLLDLHEDLLKLAENFEFDRSPINDIKKLGPCDVGLIEGGVANEENLHILQEFRAKCRILISLGDCAVMGGVPAMRNQVPLRECLEEAFLNGPTVERGTIPNDPDIPVPLDKVFPLHEVVKIDFHLPGCPPSAGAIWAALRAVLEEKAGDLEYELIKYD